jgi:hypothetical protein
MPSEQVTIDFTSAKSPLFVRQAVAAAFGIHPNQEFTWSTLRDCVCDSGSPDSPKQFLIRGLSSLAIALPDEEKSFRTFLSEVGAARPNVSFKIAIHG